MTNPMQLRQNAYLTGWGISSACGGKLAANFLRKKSAKLSPVAE
jgi:hypothetical protein